MNPSQAATFINELLFPRNHRMSNLFTRYRAAMVLAAAWFFAAGPAFAQAIKITSPSAGTTVHAGDTLSVVVSSSVPILWVTGNAPLPSATPVANPNTYQLVIPKNIIPGKYYVSASGGSKANGFFFDQVAIDVERTEIPTSIRVEPLSLSFDEVGDGRTLRTYGEFPDGEVDLTHSSSMFYASNDEQIAAISDGMVSAVAPGCTEINAAYQGVSASIPVIVPFGQEPIKYNITAAPAVPIYDEGNGNYGVLLNISNNTSIPLANFAVTAATLNSVPAGGLPPWIVVKRCATRTLGELSFPTTAGASGTQAVLQIKGTYTGLLPGGVMGQPAALSLSVTVRLP
jgi:hypothetical protein